MANASRNPASDYLRNYYLNLGLDPNAPNTPLVGTSGLSWASNRVADNMMEANRLGGPASRMVFNVNEQNANKALRTGSGSVYDDPLRGGENYVAPSWATPEAGARRLNTSSARSDARAIAEGQQRQLQSNAAAAQQRAYNQETARLRQANAFLGKLPADLQATYGRMVPEERNRVLDAGESGGYAILAGSSLRPRRPLQPSGNGMVAPGRQTDFLSGPLQIPGINQYQANPPAYRGGIMLSRPQIPAPTQMSQPTIPRPKAELGTPNQYGFEDKLGSVGSDDSLRSIDRGF